MKHLITLTLLIVTLMLSGCGERLPDGMPKPYPVTIHVIQDGKAMQGASVTLIPQGESISGRNKWTAGALTDSSGNAVIKVLARYAGAVPGNYKVAVEKLITERAGQPPADRSSKEYSDWLNNPRVWNAVDEKYSIVNTQEMLEVVAGKNAKTLDVGTFAAYKEE
ncbi:MAG: hypothetical protein LBT46_05760 [Planctomycetaceae bacterium]|jgi:hypothetical protein|nr:hypothetical protein [Planctomycetaceae bacterium]